MRSSSSRPDAPSAFENAAITSIRAPYSSSLADGVADNAVEVICPLEDVCIEPDETPEQLGSGTGLRREKVFGDPFSDPAELLG